MADTQLVHRRRGQSLHASQGDAPDGQAAGGGAKAWHMWMLFGLGWPGILLFFLSCISAFGAKVQGLLLGFGWMFCISWWLAVFSGMAFGNSLEMLNKKQAFAWKANLIMACIGSAIGGLFLTTFAYYNLPMLSIGALGTALAIFILVRSLDDKSSSTPAAIGEGSSSAEAKQGHQQGSDLQEGAGLTLKAAAAAEGAQGDNRSSNPPQEEDLPAHS